MRIKKNLVLRHIGSDYVIIESDSEFVNMALVYKLNSTAVWLWQQLQNCTFTLNVVAALLMQHYDVDADQAAIDAKRLILDMKNNGLIEDCDD